MLLPRPAACVHVIVSRLAGCLRLTHARGRLRCRALCHLPGPLLGRRRAQLRRLDHGPELLSESKHIKGSGGSSRPASCCLPLHDETLGLLDCVFAHDCGDAFLRVECSLQHGGTRFGARHTYRLLPCIRVRRLHFEIDAIVLRPAISFDTKMPYGAGAADGPQDFELQQQRVGSRLHERLWQHGALRNSSLRPSALSCQAPCDSKLVTFSPTSCFYHRLRRFSRSAF